MTFDLKKFITVISCEPCLYDVDNPNYKYLPYKESKWQEIGEMFGLNGHEAKSKFKSLRDKYRREKGRLDLEAKQPQLFPSGDAGREPWELMDDMKFLDTVRGRPPRSRPQEYAIPMADPDYDDEDYSPRRKQHAATAKMSPISPSFKFKPILLPPQKSQQHQQPTRHQPTRSQASQQSNLNAHRPTVKREFHQYSPPTLRPPQIKPQLSRHQINERSVESPNSSTPENTKHITLGSFIDQMVDQEPEETRERFSVELLDAVVKIKKQFIGEREKHLSDLYTISQVPDD